MVFNVASGCAPPKEKAASEVYSVEFCDPLHKRRFPDPSTAANPENTGRWVWFFDPVYDVLGSLLACAWMASRRWITLCRIMHGSMRNVLTQGLDTYPIITCGFQSLWIQNGTKFQTHCSELRFDCDEGLLRLCWSCCPVYLLPVSTKTCRFATAGTSWRSAQNDESKQISRRTFNTRSRNGFLDLCDGLVEEGLVKKGFQEDG